MFSLFLHPLLLLLLLLNLKHQKKLLHLRL
jgi:hypothetical protein